jgi:hypothetical protein
VLAACDSQTRRLDVQAFDLTGGDREAVAFETADSAIILRTGPHPVAPLFETGTSALISILGV